MNKKIMYYIIGISIFLIIISGIYIIIKNINADEKNSNNEYALKFKEEYESFNGKTSSSGKKYRTLTIDEKNPIVYSNPNEIIDIINSKTAIIYFGFPECPWCRNAITVLFDAAKESGIEEIYYLNIYDFRDKFEIVNGELTKTVEASEDYYKILEALDSILEDYVVEGISTNEKRLYAPTVVFVKNGKIIGNHVATVNLDEDQTPYDELTKKQIKELKNIYNHLIEQTFNDFCDELC